MAEEYYAFNDKGAATLPSKKEVIESENREIHPVLLLDSCVCLDLVKFVDHKNNAKVDKTKVRKYLDYIKRSNIETISFFGLLELCHKPDTMSFDIDKFWDFKNRIHYIEKIPMNYINSYRFDFNRDYIVKDSNELETNSLIELKPILQTSYCCFLKIRELAISGLDKHKAQKNIELFGDWLINDLDIIMALEYNLAMNIFGGNPDFRKMIGVDSKANDLKKTLWGTAWDFFHSRIVCNNVDVASRFFEENVYSTFITNDSNLFKLISQISLEAKFFLPNDEASTSVLIANNNLPQFEAAFLESFNEKMKKTFRDRLLKEKSYNESKVLEMIEKLEYVNSIKSN